MATDYDEVRADVKESQEKSLEALQSANAPSARSVTLELDEADGLDGAGVPGGEFIAEELNVQVIPQADDEFTCYSCFLVRHRSQIARQQGTHAYCKDCEA
ncbi:DUF4193 domain-containing protein [Arthrobacter crystallopoietes]|uniref:DUF4193 domain-containing protein n=1 Tax=Crystallibacter crystallopoietes TaxID=37928 RepID=UPI00111146F5|nr:DUF4193 domain-containing protein [Arthrobacter crystallopoietes]QTG80479.1 DUF4193 domain-containing protein [Arthrobacter crystallopoietes]